MLALAGCRTKTHNLSARSEPIDTATTLPRIFDLSFKAISTIVLASFLLVDLGSPQFEAILFAVLACSFYLLESFVDDLEDPFGGSWTVDAALDACDELVDALAVEE